MTKKVIVLLAEGFEETEAILTTDLLRRANIQVDLVSITEDLIVVSARKVRVIADLSLKDLTEEYDAVILPGGLPGATNLRDNIEVIKLIQNYHHNNKITAAICAAPIVLAKADIIRNRQITSYPDMENEALFRRCGASYSEAAVVVDGKIVTSRGVATIMEFSYQLIDLLGENSEQVKKAILNDRY